MATAKKWYKSTTLWINILLGASSVAGLLASFLEVGDFTVPAIVGLVFAIANVVNRLRSVPKSDLTF